MLSKRRKELFGDCALIEIIHLHDCLRGALKALETDVNQLAARVGQHNPTQCSSHQHQQHHQQQHHQEAREQEEETDVADLERRVAGRFKVIWSVFRAHSSAEDEFIWPALQRKTKGRITGSPQYQPNSYDHANDDDDDAKDAKENQNQPTNTATTTATPTTTTTDPSNSHTDAHAMPESMIEQEEYEEDHAFEESMFREMDKLLSKLREILNHKGRPAKSSSSSSLLVGPDDSSSHNHSDLLSPAQLERMAQTISEKTQSLSKHLMAHLEKEEMQCMPLVVKHLSKSEIHELVGNIMGKRSADVIAQIMTMAVQNLDVDDREEVRWNSRVAALLCVCVSVCVCVCVCVCIFVCVCVCW